MKGVIAIRDFPDTFVFQVCACKVSKNEADSCVAPMGQIAYVTRMLSLSAYAHLAGGVKAFRALVSRLQLTGIVNMQGVHSMFEGMPGRPWKDGEPRTSRMVFIGRDLDEELIREGFQQCLMRQPSVAR